MIEDLLDIRHRKLNYIFTSNLSVVMSLNTYILYGRYVGKNLVFPRITLAFENRYCQIECILSIHGNNMSFPLDIQFKKELNKDFKIINSFRPERSEMRQIALYYNRQLSNYLNQKEELNQIHIIMRSGYHLLIRGSESSEQSIPMIAMNFYTHKESNILRENHLNNSKLLEEYILSELYTTK